MRGALPAYLYSEGSVNTRVSAEILKEQSADLAEQAEKATSELKGMFKVQPVGNLGKTTPFEEWKHQCPSTLNSHQNPPDDR